MAFYDDGPARTAASRRGIEMALRRILASPKFLFRVERDPAHVAPGAAYRISDLELASRLSFFLWSSIPDDELLQVASAGQAEDAGGARRSRCGACWPIRSRDALVEQLRRPVAAAAQPAERRSRTRTSSRTSTTTCAQAFQRETELFFDSIMREDRSVARSADGRLHVRQRAAGPALRHSERLRQPVPARAGHRRRAPGPARAGQHPDGDVACRPHLAGAARQVDSRQPARHRRRRRRRRTCRRSKEHERRRNKPRSMRERMEQHRANPACASCHKLMDPLGFALENFDAVGAWRSRDAGAPIDASGSCPTARRSTAW